MVCLSMWWGQGKEFENRLLRELCDCYGIEKVRTSLYRPSTNGAIERLHRTINAMLGRIIDESQGEWDVWIPAVLAAYRASQHEATGYSPNLTMCGSELRAPVEIVLGDMSEIDYSNRKPEQAGYDVRVRPTKFPSGRGYDITVRENL